MFSYDDYNENENVDWASMNMQSRKRQRSEVDEVDEPADAHSDKRMRI